MLQRGMMTASGTERLPMEAPVRLSVPMSEYAILSACAVLFHVSDTLESIQF